MKSVRNDKKTTYTVRADGDPLGIVCNTTLLGRTGVLFFLRPSPTLRGQFKTRCPKIESIPVYIFETKQNGTATITYEYSPRNTV